MIESQGSIQLPENYCDKKKMRMLSGESPAQRCVENCCHKGRA